MFPPAAEPQSGDRARLRGAGGAFSVDQNICGDRSELAQGVFVDLSSPYWRRSLGMPATGTLPGAWGEMYVRADKPIKVTASYVAGAGSCQIETYIKPEKNRDYEATIVPFLGGKQYQCQLTIFDITGGTRKSIDLSKEKLPCTQTAGG